MEDGKGAYATIEFKSPDQPNKGLGYCICPDGNQDHTHNAIMKDMYEFCQKVGTAYLTERETWQVLRQRLNTKCVVDRLSDSGTKCNNFIQITGGALALHKTRWQLLAW